MQAKSKDLAEKDQNNQENIKRQSHYWGENESGVRRYFQGNSKM